MKRRPRKVVWVIFFHGLGSSNVATIMQSAWHTQRAALHAIAKSPNPKHYTAEKYIRA